jgi:bleomycin hydrolase
MKRIILISLLSAHFITSFAQSVEKAEKVAGSRTGTKAGGILTQSAEGVNSSDGGTINSKEFTTEKSNPATVVKNQQNTGTCWSFSGTALLESQLLKSSAGNFDLSEMFTVRNIYIEKAKNYILRQGKAQFGEGALGHDVIRAVATYGAVPEEAYSGRRPREYSYNHTNLQASLKAYLDSVLTWGTRIKRKVFIAESWMSGYVSILDSGMGVPPSDFLYNNKRYNPQTFAKEVMKFNETDYVNITSFTHHPFYSSYILEVPDNFSNGAYYNLPLKEMIELAKTAVKNGYTLMWDADVSNPGFQPKIGIGLYTQSENSVTEAEVDAKEPVWDENLRQRLYENLTTQDDHLMQITGLAKSAGGKSFFMVKNSYGNLGPFNGFVEISESYFAVNTISLVVPKAALSKAMLDKLKLN